MRFIQNILFWVYICLIFWVSLNPSGGLSNVSINDKIFRIDYLLHALVFMATPFLAFFACRKINAGYRIAYLYILFSTIVFAAIGTEFFQLYIPGRVFNPLDIISNLLGVLFGIALLLIYLRNREKQRKPL